MFFLKILVAINILTSNDVQLSIDTLLNVKAVIKCCSTDVSEVFTFFDFAENKGFDSLYNFVFPGFKPDFFVKIDKNDTLEFTYIDVSVSNLSIYFEDSFLVFSFRIVNPVNIEKLRFFCAVKDSSLNLYPGLNFLSDSQVIVIYFYAVGVGDSVVKIEKGEYSEVNLQELRFESRSVFAGKEKLYFTLRISGFGKIDIYIYNERGKLVKKLVEGLEIGGGIGYKFAWDCKDDRFQYVSPGIYILIVKINGRVKAKVPFVVLR